MSSHQPGKYINRLRFDLDASGIKSLSEEMMSKYKRVYDEIASVSPGSHTFANTVKPVADLESEYLTLASNCTFPGSVSTDKAIRDASTEAEKTLSNFAIEQSMREDVHKSILAYKTKEEPLEEQENRLLDRILRDYRRNGLALPQEEREKVKELKKRISDLCIKFQKNVNEDTSKVLLTKEELEGLPDDFLKGLKIEEQDGIQYYVVTMKYPDIFPALKYGKREDVRKRLEATFSSRCIEPNTPILEETIALRHQLSNILGYPTHAHYVLEIRMSKNPENVQNFYKNLRPKLDALARKELVTMLQVKNEEVGDKFDGKINSWDFLYFDRLINEKLYSVNEQEIKEYFPMDKVVNGTLEVYQELLGLRFEKMTGVHVWHPEVQVFEVHDRDTNDLIGHFYMDLFPRDGKYTHAAAFPLQKGCVLSDGSWQYPASAMVCNFAKPLPDAPSLLKHDEVETFFHEFGHIMHGLCAKSKYARFAGTSTERDFVECPSQMLENWCWKKDILVRVSGHYKDLSKPLPDDLLDKMIAAKNVNSGLLNLRQVFYGVFDQTVHSQEKVDTATLYNELRKEITLTEPQPKTNGAASFGHLMGGYDASYYGYLWSKVFSADLFEQFDKVGVMDKKLGKLYREKILQPGGSRDGELMLRDFLGRDPIIEPFLRSIGLETGPN